MTQNKLDIDHSQREESHSLFSAAGPDTVSTVEARIRESRIQESGKTDPRVLILNLNVQDVDLLNWLSSRVGYPKFYWQNREGDLEVAAIGVTNEERATSRAHLAGLLNDRMHRPLLSYVVAPFDIDGSSEAATDSQPRVITPTLQLVRSGNKTSLMVHLRGVVQGDNSDQIETLLKNLQSPVAEIESWETSSVGNAIVRQTDQPDKDAWDASIATILSEIQLGHVGKVVLARQSELTLKQQVDPYALLSRLRESNQNAFAFLFQTTPDKAFLGVSPERLLKIEGNQLTTEAIAGTARRGDDTIQDQQLEEELLNSSKDLAEQKFVIDAVEEAIAKFCHDSSETIARPDILKLSRVQHLVTRFTGQLRESASLGDLFAFLFPTPAVCGSPRETATALIRKLDGFDRGYYAGAFGVIAKNYAEFAVAIRSLSVSGDRLSLFAGAGIVPGSDPDLEWAELDHKLATVMAVLRSSTESTAVQNRTIE